MKVRKLTGLALVAGSLLGCGEPLPGERARAQGSPILDGTATTEHPEVVALVSGGLAYCTATLIHPRLILTAAHCLDDGAPEGVVFAAVVTDQPQIPIDRAWVHPRYDGTSSAHDVAILQLGHPVAEAPSALDYQPETTVGEPLLAVGYGIWNDGSTGVRREGEVKLGSATAEAWKLLPDAALPCVGDSGGPVFDGAGALVAVISRGDEACASYARATPLSAVRADFIAPIVALESALNVSMGSACVSAEQCLTGHCSRDAPFGWCTAPCDTAVDCGSSGRCEEGQCLPVGGRPGDLGAGCELDLACSSAFCASPRAGGARVCTRPCAADMGLCEDGFECRSSVEGTTACFAPPATSSGGCSIGGAHRRSEETLAPVAALSLLGLTRALRRRDQKRR